MRGVAEGERELWMKLRSAGALYSALSRQTRIRREVLSPWWRRYQQQGRVRLEPHSRRPGHSPTQLGGSIALQNLQLRDRGWEPRHASPEPCTWLSAPSIGCCPVMPQPLAYARTTRVPPLREESSRRTAAPRSRISVPLAKLFTRIRIRGGRRIQPQGRGPHSTAGVQPGCGPLFGAVVTALPYRIESVMTDNDLIFSMRYAYNPKRQTRFQQACNSLGIHHRLSQPQHPQTNGKVERFFRTLDEECFLVRDPG
jgi:hypothetical protein